jgi:hypothetical protein
MLVAQCTPSPRTFTVKFDSSKEVSGKKFAIHDISPGLPSDWSGYNFVVIEFRSTTAQRFQVGFTTDSGYNDLRVMSYVANAWNRLAIPLRFYTALPDANIDLAATFNQPRYTGWVNLGGRRGPLTGVDSIGIRMRVPIGNPEIEIRSISLSVEDPGDEYLGDIPSVDEFGQWNLGDYEGKAHSLEQLRSEWAAEDSEVMSTSAYNYSPYGGYLEARREATGFFRVEKVDDRWWFVDPAGDLFLSVGVDCVNPGGGGNAKWISERRSMFKELPSDEVTALIRPAARANTNSTSFGQWNLYRRYGEGFRERSADLAVKRMDKWGLNTIANWSSAEVYGLNRKAFMLQLRGVAAERNLMGLSDVYAPGYAENTAAALREFVSQYKDNPWLIGYFVGNEPAWLGEEERLCGLILEGEDSPIKAALTAFLSGGGDTPEHRKAFIFDTFRTSLLTVKEAVRRHDPNHLSLGIRFGNIAELDEELLAICKEAFDVLSFNNYSLSPDHAMMDRALRLTDMPMIIGEYHFGTVDRGMAQSLWQVNSQRERGTAYRYYTETAYSHPGLIGTAYFQWCDQDLTGRSNDGENYNCGLIDVTDRPYVHQVEAMMETAKRLFGVHSGALPPVTQMADRARGHEQIPDLWNE